MAKGKIAARGVVPATNNLGVRHPNWHPKNPKNYVAVAASAAPTKTLQSKITP